MNSATDGRRPLVTFAVIAYNQHKYVREAVRGALSQTYSPLDILLSDDCSTDGTFEIMAEEVNGYHGPHRVILNRNERNLGISAHVVRVMKLVRSELVVPNAGDDVSTPDRVQKVVDAWLESGRQEVSITSSYEVIDAEGRHVRFERFTGERLRNDTRKRIDNSVTVFGAGHCWLKVFFDQFDDIDSNVVNEDAVIQFRASLRGGILILPEVLYRYRIDGKNVSNIGHHLRSGTETSDSNREIEIAVVHHRRFIDCLRNFEKDLEKEMTRRPDSSELRSLIALVQRKRELWILRTKFFEGGLSERLRCIYRVAMGRYGLHELSRMSLFLLAPTLYRYLRNVGSKL